MALFDCVISEKYCSVEGGQGICLLFSSPPLGICHSRQKKKTIIPRGHPGGGGKGVGGLWAWVQLASLCYTVLQLALAGIGRSTLWEMLWAFSVVYLLFLYVRPQQCLIQEFQLEGQCVPINNFQRDVSFFGCCVFLLGVMLSTK